MKISAFLRAVPIQFHLVLGIVGSFLFFLGGILLLPLATSLLYSDGTWVAHVITSAVSFLIGGTLWLLFRPRSEVRIREAFLIVTLTWTTIALIGALPFWICGHIPGFTDAMYESMSGLTTTGSTILGGSTPSGVINPKIEHLPESLLLWRSLMHWIGGMGIIVLTIAILPLLGIGGMQLFLAEGVGPTADKLTPRVRETAKLLWYVYAALTVLLFFLLWSHPSMNAFDAINHAMSTMGSGGFSTRDASIAYYDSVYIETIITIFMFAAGVSFTLHFRLFRGEIQNVLKNPELRFYTLVTVLASLFVGFSLWIHNDISPENALRYGTFQAVSVMTTTGFGSHDYTTWPYFAQFVLFMLFFTGACAGSTSGGPKMIRWMILLKNSSNEIRQIIHPKAVLPLRIGIKVIDPTILRTTLSFMIIYLILFALGAMLLTFTGIDLLSAVGASISSLGNIGPGFGLYGPVENFASVSDFGKWVLIVLMLIGRLELFTVIVLISPTFWKQ